MFGDRTKSPELFELDKLYSTCTYSGKEKDLAEAERSFIDYPYSLKYKFAEMESKQEIFEKGYAVENILDGF